MKHGFRLEIESRLIHPADTGTARVPLLPCCVACPNALRVPSPIRWVVTGSLQRLGVRHMRVACRNGASQQSQKAARGFFPSLVFLLGRSGFSESVPRPLPVRVTGLKREG